MATVTVLKFATADGAEKALGLVQELQKGHLIKLHDAAIVSWPAGKKSPKTKQLVDLVGIGAMSGMFWGMLEQVVERLIATLKPDDVVLAGGNAKTLKRLPSGTRLGDNANAFGGRLRLREDMGNCPRAFAWSANSVLQQPVSG